MKNAAAFLSLLLLVSSACRPREQETAPVPEASRDAGVRIASDASLEAASDAASDASAGAGVDAAPAARLIGQYGHCSRTDQCAHGLQCCVRPVGIQRANDPVPPKECLTRAQCELRPP